MTGIGPITTSRSLVEEMNRPYGIAYFFIKPRITNIGTNQRTKYGWICSMLILMPRTDVTRALYYTDMDFVLKSLKIAYFNQTMVKLEMRL